jgi:hypothetical protein
MTRRRITAPVNTNRIGRTSPTIACVMVLTFEPMTWNSGDARCTIPSTSAAAAAGVAPGASRAIEMIDWFVSGQMIQYSAPLG